MNLKFVYVHVYKTVETRRKSARQVGHFVPYFEQQLKNTFMETLPKYSQLYGYKFLLCTIKTDKFNFCCV